MGLLFVFLSGFGVEGFRVIRAYYFKALGFEELWIQEVRVVELRNLRRAIYTPKYDPHYGHPAEMYPKFWESGLVESNLGLPI